MSKASVAIAAMLAEAKGRQAVIASGVRAAEKTLVKRRQLLAVVDAEVRELEADLAVLRRRPLTIVSADEAAS